MFYYLESIKTTRFNKKKPWIYFVLTNKSTYLAIESKQLEIMTTIEAINSLSVTELKTENTKGTLIKGECRVNGVTVLFGYNPPTEEFSSIVPFSLLAFNNLGENYLFRIGCAIKKNL